MSRLDFTIKIDTSLCQKNLDIKVDVRFFNRHMNDERVKDHNNKKISKIFNLRIVKDTSRCRKTVNRNDKKTEICTPSIYSGYVLASPK